jgi:hypothetical protein
MLTQNDTTDPIVGNAVLRKTLTFTLLAIEAGYETKKMEPSLGTALRECALELLDVEEQADDPNYGALAEHILRIVPKWGLWMPPVWPSHWKPLS